MSDKSEACPICGMPVGADVNEYNKKLEAESTTPVETMPQQNNTMVSQGNQPADNVSENNPPATPPPPSQPKPEQPKKKSKTGLIIGIVVGVIAIASVVAFFVMKGNKEKALPEQQVKNELQMPDQQTQNEAELTEHVLEAYNTHEIYKLETTDFQEARKGASAAEEASGDVCIDWDYYYCTQDDYPNRFNVTRIDFINPNKANVYVELIFDREVFNREGHYQIDNVVLVMVREFKEKESIWLVDDVWHGGNSIKEEMKECTRWLLNQRVYSNAYDGFVNIRQAPQSKAPIVGVLRNGPEGAILLGTEGEWKKIDCNGIVGYVYEKYVQFTPTEVFHGE